MLWYNYDATVNNTSPGEPSNDRRQLASAAVALADRFEERSQRSLAACTLDGVWVLSESLVEQTYPYLLVRRVAGRGPGAGGKGGAMKLIAM